MGVNFTIGDHERVTRPLPPVAMQVKLALPPRGTRSTMGVTTTDTGGSGRGGLVGAEKQEHGESWCIVSFHPHVMS